MNGKIDTEMKDRLPPEYGFSQLAGGVKEKYVDRYQPGTNIVKLYADVVRAFPTEEAVNDASSSTAVSSTVLIVRILQERSLPYSSSQAIGD